MSRISAESPISTPADSRRRWLSSSNQAGHDAAPRKIGLWAELAGVTAIYIGLVLVATYPIIRFMNSALLGGGDSGQNLWNLWWVKEALSSGNLRLFNTPLVYHPDGVSLAYHTLIPFNGLLAYPLQTLLGLSPILAFNLIALFTSVATGLGMYLLLKELTGSFLAALAGSLIFTFSPIRMSRVMYGNMQIYSTQFIPLMVWSLVRLQRTHRLRYAVGAGLFLGLTAWCSLELALGTGILAGVLFLLALLRQGEQKLAWSELGLIVLVTVVVALPVSWPLIRDSKAFPDEQNMTQMSIGNNADLLGFFVPDYVTNPLEKRLLPTGMQQGIEQIYTSFFGNPCEKSVFLGYSVLLLTGAAVVTLRRRDVWEWVAIAGLFFVLAFGPLLHIGGKPFFPMPYRLLNYVPILGTGRSPSRLTLYVMLALSVIVAHGLADWQRRLRGFRGVALLAGAIIFAEFLIAPIYLNQEVTALPAHPQVLAADSRPGAVLDVPIDLFGSQGPGGEYMLYQMVHGRPIVGGYVSRTPRAALWPFDRPFLNQLRARLYDDQEPYEFTDEVMAHAMEDLRALDVRYVVLHTRHLSAQDYQMIQAALQQVLAEPIYQDQEAIVWYLD